LFGPDGKLFVPITGGGSDRGAVRTYDVTTKEFETFILPGDMGGGLQSPWYLTFTQTNPSTLAYQPWRNFVNPFDTNGSGDVTALDALVIINELERHAIINPNGRLANSRGASKFYFDIIGNGFISSLGALRVINSLDRSPQVPASGEQLPLQYRRRDPEELELLDRSITEFEIQEIRGLEA
jgi:hypothetical protein